jgi:hypothetical protein
MDLLRSDTISNQFLTLVLQLAKAVIIFVMV